MSSFEVRTIDGDAEIEAVLPVIRSTLLAPRVATAGDLEARRSSFEPGRNFAAFDNGRVVGFAGMFSFETTVPGGARAGPTGGLTRVGVLPTHTRRGILTALLRAQLDDVAARGEPLSSLRASEATIYARFGYGLAAPFADHELLCTKSAFLEPVDDPGSVGFADGHELLTLLPAVYDFAGRTSVGALSRPHWWWPRKLEELLDPATHVPRWVAVHRDATGRADGFVDYRIDRRTDLANGAWDTHIATITDLFAATPSAYAALWRHVLDRDLVHTVRAEGRPLDEPLRARLADPRGLRTVHVVDEQWVRLVDVGAALAQRTYPDTESVTIAVDDPFLSANTGTWRLGAEGCGPTDDKPDLACRVDALGAAYLGGTSMAELAHAGRVDERTPGAVARADLLLGVRPLPWCGTWF